MRRPTPSSVVLAGCVLAAVITAASLGLGPREPTRAAPRTVVGGDDAVVPIPPARRAPDPPPPPPPSLPPGANDVVPLTLEVHIRTEDAGGHVQTVRQTVSRAADRLHVHTVNGAEWYFERNVRDPRRVSGFLVDHASRAIVIYSDSDVRNELGLPGWAFVVTLGLDPGRLADLEPSGEVRTVDRVRFTRYTTSRSDAAAPVVWWSDQHVLPGEFVTRNETGSTRVSVERARAGVNANVLQPPSFRFPDYRVIDFADWQEHH